MIACTTQAIVRFSSPFLLAGYEALQPGGYRVDLDEEPVEGASWIAWRRVGSFIPFAGDHHAKFDAKDGAD